METINPATGEVVLLPVKQVRGRPFQDFKFSDSVTQADTFVNCAPVRGDKANAMASGLGYAFITRQLF